MKNHYSKITSKGQVTVPTYVRNKMNLSTGTKLEFILDDNCIMLVPINSSVKKLQGILPKPEKALSCDKIDQIIRGAYDRD